MPELSHFLRARISPKRFSGLPLSILAIVFVIAVVLFAQTAEAVISSETIVRTDLAVAAHFQSIRTSTGDDVWWLVTALGFWETGAAVALIAIVLMHARKHSHIIAPFLLTVVGAASSIEILKLLVHRSRPEFAYYVASGYSFPSGHAAIAIALYGFLAYVLIRFAKTERSRATIIIGEIILALAIGYSRLYLGVHFLSDVWAGYLLGGAWLIVGIAFAELSHALEKDRRKTR